MSGHSHYATIKRQKGLKDAAKGKIFSKLARIIQIAVKTGGGSDPLSNYKLRMAIDTARSENMPKDNIDRAILRASSEAQNIDEVTYEGIGPGGISVIIETTTDNRNRTSQEIKNMFERGGGRLAGPGSVSFNFIQKGFIVVEKSSNVEDQILKIIDAGAEDVEETKDGIEIYFDPQMFSEVKHNLEILNFKIISSQVTMKPINSQILSDLATASKAINFLDKIEEHEDVQKVYTNLDIPEAIINALSTS